MNIDVTILIPLYNDEKHIKKTVLSVVHQAEFIIISDNGSNDGSYDICIELAKEYQNIKLFQQVKNLGGIGNLHFLYQYVRTKYVMNIGSHDYLEESYIETLKGILEKNDDTVMAFAPVVSVSDSDEVLDETMLDDFASGFGSESPLERVYTAITMEYNYAFYGLFRSDIFLKNMDFSKEAGIDHLIMAKCARDGKFLRCIDTRFYLRVPSREESPETYMERLAGEIKKIDMSYMCVHLLNIISDSKYKCAGNQEILYIQARKYLQKKYAFFCSHYIEYRLDQLSKINESLILYGAGLDAERIIPVLKDKILFIVDKDPMKQGTYKNGILVEPLETLNKYRKNKIIIGLVGRFELIALSLMNEYLVEEGRLISLDVDRAVDYV